MTMYNLHAKIHLKWWAWPVVPLLHVFIDWLWKKALKVEVIKCPLR